MVLQRYVTEVVRQVELLCRGLVLISCKMVEERVG